MEVYTEQHHIQIWDFKNLQDFREHLFEYDRKFRESWKKRATPEGIFLKLYKEMSIGLELICCLRDDTASIATSRRPAEKITSKVRPSGTSSNKPKELPKSNRTQYVAGPRPGEYIDSSKAVVMNIINDATDSIPPRKRLKRPVSKTARKLRTSSYTSTPVSNITPDNKSLPDEIIKDVDVDKKDIHEEE